MQRVLTYLLKRLGFAYLVLNAALGVVLGLTAAGAGVLLLKLYIDFDWDQFVLLLIGVEALTVAWLVWNFTTENWLMVPIRKWFSGERSPAETVRAWHCAVALPYHVFKDITTTVLSIAAPWTVFAAIVLGLSLPEAGGLFLAFCVFVGYLAVLRTLSLEVILRPVVGKLAASLEADQYTEPPVLSIRWKLLAGLPLINVITGFVVAALATQGEPSLQALGAGVLIAMAVAFTISLDLTLMLSRTILVPVRELLAGTDRVARGDFSVRMPVTTNDEVGQLTRSFNVMVAGLAERDRLREAFGSYVNPQVAERILQEGELLKGEEVEVTILFLDVRNFTGLAGRLGARGAVELINRLFERIVPILHRHGAHAITFAGDGLMALFGAPERHPDHADRALAAAREIEATVEREMVGEATVGIGLNSGSVMVGTVGGGGRLEFTAIGDAVNVAARVERATRETGDAILVTEDTRRLLRSDDGLASRPPAALKGVEEPVDLYADAPIALAEGGK